MTPDTPGLTCFITHCWRLGQTTCEVRPTPVPVYSDTSSIVMLHCLMLETGSDYNMWGEVCQFTLTHTRAVMLPRSLPDCNMVVMLHHTPSYFRRVLLLHRTQPYRNRVVVLLCKLSDAVGEACTDVCIFQCLLMHSRGTCFSAHCPSLAYTLKMSSEASSCVGVL